MKRGTTQHPKMYDLAERLSVSHAHAIGIVTLLWEYAGSHTPRGDIGSVSDKILAEKLGWPSKRSKVLIDALVGSRWLDRDELHRLVIHDWATHCEFEVCRLLHRNGKDFLDCYGVKISNRMDSKGKSRDSRYKVTGESRESHGSRVAMALALASPEKLKENNLSEFPKQQRADALWAAAGFASAEDASTWWNGLVAKHPNRKGHQAAYGAWLELVQLGRFDRGQFERWYQEQVPIWSEWQTRSVQATNLHDVFRDGLWQFEQVALEHDGLSPAMRQVLQME